MQPAGNVTLSNYTEFSIWNMSGLQAIAGSSLGRVGADWTMSGVADFNADGYADLLWRRDAGDVAIWLSDGVGGLAGTTLAVIGQDWHRRGSKRANSR